VVRCPKCATEVDVDEMKWKKANPGVSRVRNRDESFRSIP